MEGVIETTETIAFVPRFFVVFLLKDKFQRQANDSKLIHCLFFVPGNRAVPWARLLNQI